MSFLSVIDTLLLGPLKLVFEVIYMIANRFLDHPGLSIIVLSLIMNILVLPLYRRADAMQEQARDIDAKLNDGVTHIKKSFSGDERMMILQTYYRQNHYKPTDALNGSVSLLLEVPFFMAAYQFLSNLKMLEGVSLGPIADLSAPDALIVVGGLTINLLPVLMTAVNVISSAIYLKGFPLKTKIQLYGMAAFFLVFLYTSPSGLVFYWTLNNVFSLVKTIFYKLKNPKKVLSILTSVLGIGLFVFGAFIYNTDSARRKLFLIGMGVLLQLPLVLPLMLQKLPKSKNVSQPAPNRALFVLGGVFLTVLIGLLIPSAFISSSPLEFAEVNSRFNPLLYLISTGCLAAGTFLVWLGIFYWLASPKGKVMFEHLIWIACGVMLVNYMFFGTDLGVISSSLIYEKSLRFTGKEIVLNIVVMAAVAGLLFAVSWKKVKAAQLVLLTATLALLGMSAVNAVTANSIVQEAYDKNNVQDSVMPHFTLSKNGKNVVVLMLDRAMGEYVPYIMNEDPELAEQFAGFTYYSNTISFGGSTNFGVPAVFGGYEYTPVEMNKRGDEKLVDKHNESLLVMPLIFNENDYRVQVFNPTYAGYQWIPDLSMYDRYPEISAYNINDKFLDPLEMQQLIKNNHRNFFCFSLMKTLPLALQKTVYDSGGYNQAETFDNANLTTAQNVIDISNATGNNSTFNTYYRELQSMSAMTTITEDSTNSLVLMSNDITHEATLLQTPGYVPAETVNNVEFDALHTDRFTVNGVTLNMENSTQMMHYHVNMAAFLQLGKWFDYLRENGVYDNTRIILVSDHGRDMEHFAELVFDGGDRGVINAEQYFPLLMVKDFGSETFTTSDAFMTNADVPSLAMEGLIEKPQNPFTGKPITMDEKTAHDQIIIVSSIFSTYENNGNTFLPARWASVKENAWDLAKWSIYTDEMVLTEHALP